MPQMPTTTLIGGHPYSPAAADRKKVSAVRVSCPPVRGVRSLGASRAMRDKGCVYGGAEAVSGTESRGTSGGNARSHVPSGTPLARDLVRVYQGRRDRTLPVRVYELQTVPQDEVAAGTLIDLRVLAIRTWRTRSTPAVTTSDFAPPRGWPSASQPAPRSHRWLASVGMPPHSWPWRGRASKWPTRCSTERALPLDEGTRTLDLLHGKQTL